MWGIFDIVVFVAGFAACWYAKDPIVKAVVGTETFVKSLEAKIVAVKASV